MCVCVGIVVCVCMYECVIVVCIVVYAVVCGLLYVCVCVVYSFMCVRESV